MTQSKRVFSNHWMEELLLRLVQAAQSLDKMLDCLDLERFQGAVIIDDAHKPDEVHSDTIRQSVIDNYRETIQQRARGINVPFIFIGQRLHEDDLGAYLIAGKDGYEWHKLSLKVLMMPAMLFIQKSIQ